jgi:hypothetical protein
MALWRTRLTTKTHGKIMKTRATFIPLFTVFALLVGGMCAVPQTKPKDPAKEKSPLTARPMVTFVELGSVNCIPCKAMQPVMKAIEGRFL